MGDKGGVVHESFSTSMALERFLSRMLPPVRLDVALHVEPLSTNVAAERFFSRMDPNMALQLVLAPECLLTIVALIAVSLKNIFSFDL